MPNPNQNRALIPIGRPNVISNRVFLKHLCQNRKQRSGYIVIKCAIHPHFPLNVTIKNHQLNGLSLSTGSESLTKMYLA